MIDLRAYDRGMLTNKLLLNTVVFKDKIIKELETNFATQGRQLDNEKFKVDLLMKELDEVHEVNKDLVKKLKRNKKSKTFLLGGGLAVGLILGVLLAK